MYTIDQINNMTPMELKAANAEMSRALAIHVAKLMVIKLAIAATIHYGALYYFKSKNK